MESVGVRELRQNASKLLERVADGETLAITNHGREVARLVPSTGSPLSRAEMAERGLLLPGSGHVLNFTPLAASGSASEDLLDELRAERL